MIAMNELSFYVMGEVEMFNDLQLNLHSMVY